MAAGNTFGATALSSYGGFWISLAIVFTPGGFSIMSSLEKAGGGTTDMFYDSLGLFLLVRPFPSPTSIHPSIIILIQRAGLVHIHLPPRPLHAKIHLRLLRHLRHRRHRLPASRHRIHTPQRLLVSQ